MYVDFFVILLYSGVIMNAEFGSDDWVPTPIELVVEESEKTRRDLQMKLTEIGLYLAEAPLDMIDGEWLEYDKAATEFELVAQKLVSLLRINNLLKSDMTPEENLEAHRRLAEATDTLLAARKDAMTRGVDVGYVLKHYRLEPYNSDN